MDLQWLDYAAAAFGLACWAGFDRFAGSSRPARGRPSLSQAMDHYREGWMAVMVRREMRMVDTMIQGSVLQGCTFFASTAILLVGGLLAVLGAPERAIEIVGGLPFTVETTRSLWQTKVLALVMMLVYAFFKFAWAYRLYSYCIVVVGASPMRETPESPRFAERAARLLSLGSRHFDRGIRAYYYTLAASAWFLHPVLFMLTTAWVTVVLVRREFRSRTRAILLSDSPGPSDSSGSPGSSDPPGGAG